MSTKKLKALMNSDQEVLDRRTCAGCLVLEELKGSVKLGEHEACKTCPVKNVLYLKRRLPKKT